jgi:CheY-like chemotaxis protein
MARQLVEFCDGSLEIAWAGTAERVFDALITLPVTEQVTVLVIDDNVDTLQLFERYLTGTRYRFVGSEGAQQGLDLAVQVAPRIIVLDVMMPEQDGWALLEQLREDAQTRECPVIVSTILPQEELAMALGAAAFIRKPVGRTELLSALDRQLGLLLRESLPLP